MQCPNYYGIFSELPLSAVKPEGWLFRYLEIQRDGLTGHLEAAGYPFNTEGWASEKPIYQETQTWWPYEQTAYWVDGMMRCGHLIQDATLLNKARHQTNYVLRHQAEDGYLGPDFLRDTSQPEGDTRWSHTVFFRALMADASATNDGSIIHALKRHYLQPEADHSNRRDVTNLECMLWLYERTGDEALLDLAQKNYEKYNRVCSEQDTSVKNMLSGNVATEHGVTYHEQSKIATILYLYTGNETLLKAARNANAKLDRDQMLVSGIPSASEELRGKDPLDSHETCDIADYTWNAGYLLLATGDAQYADKIEKACFNALPGAVTPNFGALQYFSCPNQFIADNQSNHNLFSKGKAWMSYRPNPGTACCAGNVHRVMPNYCSRMWLSDNQGGIVAALYGPCKIQAQLGKSKQPVTIIEETTYPFSDTISFRMKMAEPVQFNFSLRIPAWCKEAGVLINGKPVHEQIISGSYLKLSRNWQDGDNVTVKLPMSVRLQTWPRGGLTIERGPLTYSLPVAECWQVFTEAKTQTAEFPAWNIQPTGDFNFALNKDLILDHIKVEEKNASLEPWSVENAPVRLTVPARCLNGWKLAEPEEIESMYWLDQKVAITHLTGKWRMTPQLPETSEIKTMLAADEEDIQLVPYGCTQLRLTVFPQYK